MYMKLITVSCVLAISTSTIKNTSMTKNEKQRVTIFLHHALLKQAKAQAIVEDLSLTTLIEKALVKYLPRETVIRKADI